MRCRSLYIVLFLLSAGFTAPAQYEEPPAIRVVPEKVVDSLQHDKAFAYANDDRYIKQREEEEEESGSSFWDGFYNFFRNNTVRTFTIILLIAFLLFVIYRIIVVNNLFVFYRNKKIPVEEEQEEVDIRDENLDDRISKAIREKDYRSAVRFLYLKGLRLLNDKGWIRYHAQATNHEYVHQLNQNPVAGDFRFLTQVYDYVWYGEFPVNDEQFDRLQSDFKRFYQAVR